MCEKHNRICPGYRNLVDLMFRDESEHVIWKANKPKGRSPRRSSASPIGSTERKSKKLEQRRTRLGTRGSTSPGATSASTGSPVTQSPSLSSNGTGMGLGIRQYGKHLSPCDMKLESPEVSLRTLSILTPTSAGSGGYFTLGSTSDDTSDEEDLFLPSPDEGTWPSSPSSAQDYTLSPIFQEQGMAFFFSRYVAAAHENIAHNNYDFIYDIWRPNRSTRDARVDAVLASMTAVGLAAMSSLTCSPERLDWARQSYVTALRLTNDALMDPAEARKDSTLLAVLILGMYEMLAGPGPETMRAWRGHMRGAAALARLRGPGQFKTRAGVRMFLMLCETLAVDCMHEGLPMPGGLVELRDVLGAASTTLDTTWNAASPLYRLLQIQHDIKSGRVCDTQDIINSLLTVDEEYVGLVAGIPDSSEYTVVRLERPNPAVLGQLCHVYPSLEAASTWNTLRTLRLLVHETILAELHRSFRERSLDAVPMEHKVQLARSRRLLGQLRDAVLASVPQHFGVVSYRDVKGSSAQPDFFGSVLSTTDSPYRVLSAPLSVLSPTTSPSSSISTPSSKSNPGLAPPEAPTLLDFLATPDADALFASLASAPHPLVWPLYLVGVSSSCTPAVADFVVGRLVALFVETRLAQAGSVAEVVAGRDCDAGGACGRVWVGGLPDVSREPTPVRV